MQFSFKQILKTCLYRSFGLVFLINTQISIKDTRVSYITNSLDQNERMGFIQKQVGHTSTRMIVNNYYRYIPATDDGTHLENAWNSTSILPVSEGVNL